MEDMSEITIPKTTITNEQYARGARQLAMAILLQATRDYCKSKSEGNRKVILKDLRSNRMDFISDGTSIMVAEQLELHPDEICERVRKQSDIAI